ncbi:LysM peptidoglycan-binding domain-containing protein [Bacillus sp. SG-1]|uniref:LysM peptidoglycan-binding domain-containing protein n=1 Tax=Bacillus sp. SG-1 TaxID=161544 RepID=UPI000154438D|nr:LysM domain-containing protein [Bacillus sp. SG-1]EDL65433.1 Peptidoglycan-binding LysM [Bacillus sp. SG-1]
MKKTSKILAPALALGMIAGGGAASAAGTSVTVEKGDTLWGIAQNHDNVSVNNLYDWNPGLDARSLEIGSEIMLHDKPEYPNETFHTVTPGETLWSIANLHAGLTLEELYELNPEVDPYSLVIGSDVKVSPSSREVFHTVKPDETLWSISNLHANLTLDDLYDLNPDIDPRSLAIGSEVRVR